MSPPMSSAERVALVQAAEEALGRLAWGAPLPPCPAVFFDAEREVIVLEAVLPAAGAAGSPGIWRMVAVAMVMSLLRPRWLWTIRDDADAVGVTVGAAELVAWRGIYGSHPYPTPAWSALDVTKDQLFDHTVRWAMEDARVGGELAARGVRVPPRTSGGEAPRGDAGAASRLLLFDYQPAPGWQAPGVDALVVLGRSMVQVDGRRGDGLHRVQGRIEVHNPSGMDLTGARVQARLCDAGGTLLAVVEGALAGLPAGTTRLIEAQGEVRLGGRAVASVDLGCEAQLARSVRFQARIMDEEEQEA